jgi:hypothetical protein
LVSESKEYDAKNDIIHEVGQNTVSYYPIVGILLSFPQAMPQVRAALMSSQVLLGTCVSACSMNALEIESIPGEKESSPTMHR